MRHKNYRSIVKESYTVKIKSDKIELSQPLPAIAETGIIITYNNNLPKNILAVAIKTNDKGFELYKNKKLKLLMHQDGNSIQKELTFTPIFFKYKRFIKLHKFISTKVC